MTETTDSPAPTDATPAEGTAPGPPTPTPAGPAIPGIGEISPRRFSSPPPDAPTEASDTTPTEDTAESGNAEAAKWRKKLREAETRAETLTAQVEALQKAQIDNLIETSGVKPSAVWMVTALPDLLTEDGTVNAEAVAAAIETARTEFGIPGPTKGTHVPGAGNMPGRAVPSPQQAFVDAFGPRRR